MHKQELMGVVLVIFQIYNQRWLLGLLWKMCFILGGGGGSGSQANANSFAVNIGGGGFGGGGGGGFGIPFLGTFNYNRNCCWMNN